MAHLSEAFAKGILTLEDYEERLEKATAAVTLQDLEMIVADLYSPPPPHYRDHAVGAVERPTAKPLYKPRNIIVFMGSRELTGPWMKSDSVYIKVLMGSVECDLTRTPLFPVNRIHVISVMSEVNLLVPRNATVTASLTPIMAEVKHRYDNEEALSGAPHIEIGGVAVLSEVNIRS